MYSVTADLLEKLSKGLAIKHCMQKQQALNVPPHNSFLYTSNKELTEYYLYVVIYVIIKS